MRVLLKKGAVTIEAIRQPWSELVKESSANWVFSTPEWVESWLDAFGGREEVLVAVVYDGDELVGVLPVLLNRSDWKFLFSRKLTPLNGVMGDYFAPIVKRGMEQEVSEALINEIFNGCGRRGIVDFPHIPEEHPTLQKIREGFLESGLASVETKTICPRLNFFESYQATEMSFKSSHRGDIRRQKRRLAEKGELSLEVLSDVERAKGYLGEFIEIYDQRWKSAGQKSIFDREGVRAFYEKLIEKMAGSYLHFSLLKVGEEVISYHFGFQFDGWIYWYKPTYKLEYEKLSPSKVHLSLLAQEGIEDGLTGIDLLSGDEPYKAQWANERRATTSIVGSYGLLKMGYRFNLFSKRVNEFKNRD